MSLGNRDSEKFSQKYLSVPDSINVQFIVVLVCNQKLELGKMKFEVNLSYDFTKNSKT